MTLSTTSPWIRWPLRAVVAGALTLLFVTTAYTAFSLYIRRGGTVLPDVVGLTVAEAMAQLDAVGVDLMVVEDDARFSATVVEGGVVQQRPSAGASVKKGSSVRVSLSKGPELAYLPDFTGDSVAVARTRVQSTGLPAPRILWVYEEGAAGGQVVAQRPRPGERSRASEPIRLYANLRDSESVYLMPDVVYQNAERMRRWFEGRGMRVGSMKPDRYPGVAPGTVLRQYPLTGYPLSPGDAVAFVISSGDNVRASL